VALRRCAGRGDDRARESARRRVAFALLVSLDLIGANLRLVGADAVIYLLLSCGSRLAIRSLHEWERRVRLGNGRHDDAPW